MPWASHATHGHLFSPRSWKEELATFDQVVNGTVDFYESSLWCREETVLSTTYPQTVKRRHSSHRAVRLSSLLEAVVRQCFVSQTFVSVPDLDGGGGCSHDA